MIVSGGSTNEFWHRASDACGFLLASQHRHDHADVFVHIRKRVQPKTHTPPTSVARSEASIDLPRGQRVQSGESIGCYGHNTL
jgi:hypothetical protein